MGDDEGEQWGGWEDGWCGVAENGDAGSLTPEGWGLGRARTDVTCALGTPAAAIPLAAAPTLHRIQAQRACTSYALLYEGRRHRDLLHPVPVSSFPSLLSTATSRRP
jgi:hypothetical protein